MKILACVAAAIDIRVDIYVSPARVISGRDVPATHLFLRCLAIAARSCSINISQGIASDIVRVGETVLYKESVKTRNTIMKMQAIIRGKRVRRYHLQSVDVDHQDRKQINQVKILQVECPKESNYQDTREMIEDKLYEKKSKVNCDLHQPTSPDISDDQGTKHGKEQIQPIKIARKQHKKTRDDDKNSGINMKEQIVSFSNPSSQPPSPRRDQVVMKVTIPHSATAIDPGNESSLGIEVSEYCQDCKSITTSSKNTEGQAENRVEVKTICSKIYMSEDKTVQSLCSSSTQTEISTQVRVRKRHIKQSDRKTLRNDVSVEKCGAAVDQSTQQQKTRASSSMQVKALIMETLVNPVKETKCRIINGIMMRENVKKNESTLTQSQSNVEVEQKHKEDEAKSMYDDTRRLQEKLKKDLMKVQKRESRLKHRLEEVKSKEEQLKIHETRVAKLAENFRRKQERLHQDGIHQSLEMDKLRLQITEAAKECHKYNEKYIQEGDSQQEDMLKRVSDHPNITDLRLKLERKERVLIRRGQKMKKFGKVLRREREALNKISNGRKDEQQRLASSGPNCLVSSLNPNLSQISGQIDTRAHPTGFTSEGKGQESLEKKEIETFTPNNSCKDVSSNERVEDCNNSIRGQSVCESEEGDVSAPICLKAFSGNKTKSPAAIPKTSAGIDLQESQKSSVKKRNGTLLKKRSDKSLDTHYNNLEEFPRRLASYSSHYKELERQTYLIHPSREI